MQDIGPIDEFYDDPYAAVGVAGEASLRLEDLRLAPPVPMTARIFCVGINYRSHADEAKQAGLDEPDDPIIFGRWPRTLIADGDPVPVPPKEEGLDWEAELAVVKAERR